MRISAARKQVDTSVHLERNNVDTSVHVEKRTSTDRVARHRARAVQGRRCITIEIADALSAALADAGLIREDQVDDWDAIAAAVERVLDTMVAEAT